MVDTKIGLVIFSIVSLCSAGQFDDFSLDEGDFLVNSQDVGRTFTNFNFTSTGLVIDPSSIGKIALILLLFKILYAIAFGSSLFKNFSNNSYDRIYQNRRDSYNDDEYYSDDTFSSRLGTVGEDFATLMYSLEQAFKKYSVSHVECQMYVACEAAHVSRHEENGPLASMVYDIVSKMMNHHEFHDSNKMTPEIEGITQAFTYGQQADLYGQEDSCAPLRKKCFELHSNKKQHKQF